MPKKDTSIKKKGKGKGKEQKRKEKYESDSGSDSDDSLIPDNVSCFITAASSDAGNIQPLCNWREIGRRELLIVFCLMVLGCVGTEIFLRFRQKRGDGDKRLGRIAL